jgi:uncharacterized membrane protein
MNSQKVNLSTPNMLGGIGGILFIIGPLFSFLDLDFIYFISSFANLILILVAFHQYSQILNNPSIFQYGLRCGITSIVTVIVTVITVIVIVIVAAFARHSDVVVLLVLLVYGATIYGATIFVAVNLKNALKELSITLNHNLFNISGNLIFWGAILLIILIGAIVSFVGYILLTIAFFTAPKEIELTNNNVLNLDSTVNYNVLVNCNQKIEKFYSMNVNYLTKGGY